MNIRYFSHDGHGICAKFHRLIWFYVYRRCFGCLRHHRQCTLSVYRPKLPRQADRAAPLVRQRAHRPNMLARNFPHGNARLFQHTAHAPRLECLRHPCKRQRFFPRLRVQIGIVLPHKLCRLQCMACRTRLNIAQCRNDMMPNFISRAAVIQIGGIRTPVLSARGQKLLDLPPFHRDERADNAAAHGRDTRQTGASRAADQMEQHGFQIIIRRVCGRKIRHLHLFGTPSKKVIPHFPRRSLCGQLAFFRLCEHIAPFRHKRNAVFFAKIAAKCLVCIRLCSAHAVVEMAGTNLIPQFLQAQHQTDRIRTAGKSAQHARTVRQHMILSDRMTYQLFHSCLRS